MARTIREAKLGTPTSRRRLEAGRQPHWHTIVAGRDHLGYQRWPHDCMSSEHFGQLAWQFKRMSGSSGLKVQAVIAC